MAAGFKISLTCSALGGNPVAIGKEPDKDEPGDESANVREVGDTPGLGRAHSQ